MATPSDGTFLPKGLRLLVVDDNRDAADSLALLTGMWGHQTRTAYDAVAAMREALAHLPDAVFLDIGMPRTSGFSLAAEMRGRIELRGTTLIAVTGFAGEAHERESRRVGFDYYFAKPVDPEKLQHLLVAMQRSGAGTGEPGGPPGTTPI